MGGNWLTTIGPLILFFVIVYFLLIRPQQKRQKKTREMQSNLEKGNQIVTIGGLHGNIDAVDEDVIVIRVQDGSKLTYDKSAVRDVVDTDEKDD